MTAPDPAAERAWVEGLMEGTTPGVWRAVRDVVTSDAAGCQVHAMHHAPEYRDLLRTSGPRWLADARLIAAAPDLAARYRAALDRLEAAEAERDRLRDICHLAAHDLLSGTPGVLVAGSLRRLSDPQRDANAHKDATHDRS